MPWPLGLLRDLVADFPEPASSCVSVCWQRQPSLACAQLDQTFLDREAIGGQLTKTWIRTKFTVGAPIRVIGAGQSRMVGPPSSRFVRILMPNRTTGTAPLTGLALRVFWMILGPATLFALAMLMAQHRGSWMVDLGYVSAVMLVLAARYLDISRFDGTTDTGEPATIEHFRRYAMKLFLVAAAVWSLVHLAR